MVFSNIVMRASESQLDDAMTSKINTIYRESTVPRPAVCHSSPFFRQSPFRRFSQFNLDLRLTPLTKSSKCMLPNEDFGKMNKDEMRILEAKGVSTRFEIRIFEKYLEHHHFVFCSSFQNLRLGTLGSIKWRLSKKGG